MARAYLLYLFGASLFLNRRGSVHLGWLPALENLEIVGKYDWGGAGLATVYCFLGFVSRGVAKSLGDFWRVLEVKLDSHFCCMQFELMPLCRIFVLICF